MARKILTITCHNVYNHGATLQQLALLNQLEAMGFEAATIDYSPNYLNQHFKWTKVSNAFFAQNGLLKLLYWVLKFPQNLWNRQRKWRFDAFESKTLRTHPGKYSQLFEPAFQMDQGVECFFCSKWVVEIAILVA